MEKEYAKPSVTADIVIFTVKDGELKILLVKRSLEPFKNKWALPGGFVRLDESLEGAAKRELREETGVKDVYLEQLYTFGDPKRDIRGRVITVAYMALINSEDVKLRAQTDVSEAKWFSVKKIPSLAFDHKIILDYSLKRLKWKFEYTPIAFSLLPEKFTFSQLRGLYEIVFAREFDKRNFYKKIFSLNILEEKGKQKGVAFRPAALYELKKNLSPIVNMV